MVVDDLLGEDPGVDCGLKGWDDQGADLQTTSAHVVSAENCFVKGSCCDLGGDVGRSDMGGDGDRDL